LKKVYKFSATWCQPCKALSMALAQKDIKLPEYDIDEPDTKPLLQRFGVRSVPTVIVEAEDGSFQAFTGSALTPQLLEAIA
jgi:thioredoxin-like negative regulator of GroEL